MTELDAVPSEISYSWQHVHVAVDQLSHRREGNTENVMLHQGKFEFVVVCWIRQSSGVFLPVSCSFGIRGMCKVGCKVETGKHHGKGT